MAILKIPTPLRSYTDGQTEVTVGGGNVAEAMEHLVEQYPTLKPHLYNGEGRLRPFVNLFLGENNVNDLQGMQTPLDDKARLHLNSIDSRWMMMPSPILPGLTREEILRYSRHLLIPEVGLDGQRKLKGASALVIGTGGLGSPVSLYLAAAGVGRIGLVDFDVVEFVEPAAPDHSRDEHHRSSSRWRARAPSWWTSTRISRWMYTMSRSHLRTRMRIAADYDILLDGTDNFPTRYLTNDVAVFLGKPNVYASIYRFDGQVSVFDAKNGPCYRCLFPEPPPPGLVPSCAEGGVLGVLPGTIGTIQATEALKVLLGIGDPLIGKLLLYNALDMSFDFVKLKKNPKCRVCGEDARH